MMLLQFLEKKQTSPRLKTTVLNAATTFNVNAFLNGICK